MAPSRYYCCCASYPQLPCEKCLRNQVIAARPALTSITQRNYEPDKSINPSSRSSSGAHYANIVASTKPRTIQEILGLPANAELNLDSLIDPAPGKRPHYTLSTLIKLAILGSPRQELTLLEIYQAIEKRFVWYANKENPKAWKTSIRHVLSIAAAFQKKKRTVSYSGKGCYWQVDLTKGEVKERPQRRRQVLKKSFTQGETKETPVMGTTRPSTSPQMDKESDENDSGSETEPDERQNVEFDARLPPQNWLVQNRPVQKRVDLPTWPGERDYKCGHYRFSSYSPTWHPISTIPLPLPPRNESLSPESSASSSTSSSGSSTRNHYRFASYPPSPDDFRIASMSSSSASADSPANVPRCSLTHPTHRHKHKYISRFSSEPYPALKPGRNPFQLSPAFDDSSTSELANKVDFIPVSID